MTLYQVNIIESAWSNPSLLRLLNDSSSHHLVGARMMTAVAPSSCVHYLVYPHSCLYGEGSMPSFHRCRTCSPQKLTCPRIESYQALTWRADPSLSEHGACAITSTALLTRERLLKPRAASHWHYWDKEKSQRTEGSRCACTCVRRTRAEPRALYILGRYFNW